MGTTDKGIVFPDADSSTLLWEHFQALAESVDEAIDADAGTTLVTAWTPMTLTPDAGFNVSAARYRVFLDALVVIDATFTRVGGPITGTGVGNMPDTAVAHGLPAAIRPAGNRYLDFMRSTVANGRLEITSAGQINAVTIEGGAVLESTIYVHDFYVLG